MSALCVLKSEARRTPRQIETSCVGKTWSNLADTNQWEPASESHNSSQETNKDQEKENWSLTKEEVNKHGTVWAFTKCTVLGKRLMSVFQRKKNVRYLFVESTFLFCKTDI